MPNITLIPTDDALIDQDTPDTNYGTVGWLCAGVGNTIDIYYYGVTRTYIKFDLTSIPAGSTINSASLTMYSIYDVSNYSEVTYKLYQTRSSNWTEGTITWNDQPGLGSVYSAIDSTGAPQYTYYMTVTGAVSTSLSSGVLSVVLAAYDETVSGTFLNFSSKEYDESLCPQLYITYTAPVASKGNFFLIL